ncbi:MAG: bifunctional hydroxymethylpyrimidine kinase/phosphomethylpyrimidine kinase [Cytophagales bacterium]
MTKQRPFVLTIAGHDPSGGAGVLADIKVFEQHKVYGLGVTTCVTYQNESEFIGVSFINYDSVVNQITPLKKYPIKYIKIGLIESLEFLEKIILVINDFFPNAKIIWDPILKASASKDSFHANWPLNRFEEIVSKLFVITPNFEELNLIYNSTNSEQNIEKLRKHCNIYLKGGHRNDNLKGYDIWYEKNSTVQYTFKPKHKLVSPKHGSGCILSAALLSNFALGNSVIKSCLKTKFYTEQRLVSNLSKLAYHK